MMSTVLSGFRTKLAKQKLIGIEFSVQGYRRTGNLAAKKKSDFGVLEDCSKEFNFARKIHSEFVK